MSITDELREYVNMFKDKAGSATICVIANRIDEEHEREVADARNDALYRANDKDMAELGWVRLPVDADGEYIHVGDWLEGHTSRVFADDAEYLALPLVAKSLTLTPDGWHVGSLGLDPAELHHPKQTVEDVLREFGKCWDDPAHYAKGELVEAFAARLQLRED